ncbi:transmembrane 4 L6 family member 5-like, partial [Plectropomus leopardus]|uniref:transmembrane 4 L6 family member 5-like n=1 Tax=Plectropomus leopardus TaxID=160734 RepID=UPI001C4DBA90
MLPVSIYGARLSSCVLTSSHVINVSVCPSDSELDHLSVNICRMCVSRCLRCVSVSLVAMAIVCILSNILLLLPDLKIHFLLEGHVTREATWTSGLWGSGLLVLLAARRFDRSSRTQDCWAFRRKMLSHVMSSCGCLLAAGVCCYVSATGLSQGPLCLYNTTSGPSWGVPLQPVPNRHTGYLNNRTLWSSVCLEPRGVVLWNLVLFGVMGGASGLQTVLCAANILNSLLGLILGQGFCHHKVCLWCLLSYPVVSAVSGLIPVPLLSPVSICCLR